MNIRTIFFLLLIGTAVLSVPYTQVSAQNIAEGDGGASDDAFGAYDDLFSDIDGSDETGDDKVGADETGGAGGFDDAYKGVAFDFSQTKPELDIYGEHTVFFPFPINPDYLDYQESGRSPRQQNILGFEYAAPHVDVQTELKADYYVSNGGASTANLYDNLRMNLGQTYVSVYNDLASFSAGFKEYAWGSALAFNPTDNLNARDFRNGIFSEKVPLFSAALNFYPTRNISLETVFVPVYQEPVYPVDVLQSFATNIDNNIQNATSFGGMSEAQFANISTKTVKVQENSPANDFSQFQLGERINFFLPFADMSLSYMYDVDDYYSVSKLNAVPVGSDVPPRGLSIDYYLDKNRLHRFGIDILSSVGPVGLWAEVVGNFAQEFYASSYSTIRNHNIMWTVGTDFSLGKDNALHITLQQLGTYILHYPTTYETSGESASIDDIIAQQNYALAQQTEGLRLGGMLDMTLGLLDDKFNPAFRAVYFYPLLYDESVAQRYGSLLALPSIEIAPVDSMSISIGSELSFAWQDQNASVIINEQDPLGQAVRYNKMFIEFNYQWSRRL